MSYAATHMKEFNLPIEFIDTNSSKHRGETRRGNLKALRVPIGWQACLWGGPDACGLVMDHKDLRGMSDARFLRMIQVFFERQGIHLRYLNETLFDMNDVDIRKQ
jgi:hypothetical protein